MSQTVVTRGDVSNVNTSFSSDAQDAIYIDKTTGTLNVVDKAGVVSAVAGGGVQPTNPNVTAKAGGGQDANLAQKDGFVLVAVTANIGDSITLGSAVKVGQTTTVINRGDKSIDVFPFTGQSINGLAADASVAIPTLKTGTFVVDAAGHLVSTGAF